MKTETEENPAIHVDADVCCPQFDPAPWEKTTHVWNSKLFLKDSIPELFHIPLPGTYKRAVSRMWKKAEDAGAAPDLKDFLLLAYDPSPFKSELFMSITKEISGEENVRLSGTYISKVFDGPYNKVPAYIDEMNGYLASIGKSAKKHYIYFTTCPKCAEKYGHNYILALAEV